MEIDMEFTTRAIAPYGDADDIAVSIRGCATTNSLGNISDYRLISFDMIAAPPVEGAYPRITDAAWVRGGCWTDSPHAARRMRIIYGGMLGELPSVGLRASWRCR